MIDGIFADLRHRHYNLADSSIVNITSPEVSLSWEKGSNYYCSINNVIPSPIYCVIDGLPNTAWAQLDDTKDKKSITFDFFDKHIYVHTISIQTLCAPPREIIFESYNQVHSKWVLLHHLNTPLQAYSITNITLDTPSNYPKIRLTHIGRNVEGSFRFHIHNIEFYGTLHMTHNYITCINQKTDFSNIFVIIFLLVIK